MYAASVEFDSRAALADALQVSLAEGGLFVPGDFDVPVGSPIVLRVMTSGLATEVFVEGVVQWRRVGARAGQTGVNPGLGVRMLHSHHERLLFLRDWATGRGEESGRRESRCPTDLACVLTSVGRNTGRILHATLHDVSGRGAMVTVPMALTPGQIYVLELMADDGPRAFPARVAWSLHDRAGLRLTLERTEEQTRWKRVVDAANEQFARALIQPRNGAAAPMAHPASSVRRPSTPPAPSRGSSASLRATTEAEHEASRDQATRVAQPYGERRSIPNLARVAPVIRETMSFERPARATTEKRRIDPRAEEDEVAQPDSGRKGVA